MKRGFNILMLFAFILVIIGCNKNKSYADRLKDEKKAIGRLLDDSAFVLIKDYPENGVFEENEFVQLSNGVYLNVVDSGNGNRAVLYNTEVLYRCRFRYLDSDELIDLFAPHHYPIEFIYGNHTVSSSYPAGYQLLSEGVGSILNYVGDSAIVRLIVPFKVGSPRSQQYYETIFYDRLKFTFAP
ncbi:MAG: DUF4827 domain-containing protein [Tannerellaceae bacterium]|nr:DUF4827 domain-containing protein [Tannerellaceae bacterium]